MTNEEACNRLKALLDGAIKLAVLLRMRELFDDPAVSGAIELCEANIEALRMAIDALMRQN